MTRPRSQGLAWVGSRENRSFFTRSAALYDYFVNAMFLGAITDLREAAVREIPANERRTCLDMASGTGDTARAFAKVHPGCRVLGLDISRAMLLRARRKRGPSADYVQGTVERLPYPDETFDIVMSSCAFFLLNPSKNFPEWLRVLKPGGLLVDVEIISRLQPGPRRRVLDAIIRPYQVFLRLKGLEERYDGEPPDVFRTWGLEAVEQRGFRNRAGRVLLTLGKKPLGQHSPR